MIKYSTLPKNIKAMLPRGESYLESQPDVLFAYLFGSLPGDRVTPLSDVDMAVFLSDTTDFSKRKLELLCDLIDNLETDEVDLVVLNTASLPLRMRILEKGKLILDKQPFLRQEYESLTMREYLDFAIFETSLLERRFLNAG